MATPKLRDLSVDFAIVVIKVCDNIKGHSSIIDKLERSATAIGANIHEVSYFADKDDYIAKLQDSLKECHATEYWLELLTKSGLIGEMTSQKLTNTCGTLRCIIEASINNAKKNSIK